MEKKKDEKEWWQANAVPLFNKIKTICFIALVIVAILLVLSAISQECSLLIIGIPIAFVSLFYLFFVPYFIKYMFFKGGEYEEAMRLWIEFYKNIRIL